MGITYRKRKLLLILSSCMNQSSPLDSWSTLSAAIDCEHLAHRLEPQCYRPLIYRLALVPLPICSTDD